MSIAVGLLRHMCQGNNYPFICPQCAAHSHWLLPFPLKFIFLIHLHFMFVSTFISQSLFEQYLLINLWNTFHSLSLLHSPFSLPLYSHSFISLLLLGCCVCVYVCGCPQVWRVDGAQLSELSITLPGDGIRMFRGHTAPIWHCADKSAASRSCVCVGRCIFVYVCAWRGCEAEGVCGRWASAKVKVEVLINIASK